MSPIKLNAQLAAGDKPVHPLHRQGKRRGKADRRTSRPRELADLSTALLKTRDSAGSLARLNRQLKRFCQVLKSGQRHYQRLFEYAPEGYVVTDARGRIREVNRAAGLMLRKKRGQLSGMSLALFIEEGQQRAFREHIRRLNLGSQGRVSQGVYKIAPGSGACLDVALSVAATRSTEGRLVQLRWLMRDMKERPSSAEARRAANGALERNQEALRALTARLLRAQDEERRRVSRELHDDLCQKLAVLILEIETLERNLPLPHLQILEQLRSFRERVSDLSDDAHHLAYRLHPSVLEDLGLTAAMRTYIRDFAAREGIWVQLVQKKVPRSLPLETASCLYRVMQESLRNAARHARTRRVSVALTGSAHSVRLSVKDWGAGFDPESLRSKHSSLGIVGMEERVRLAQGTFSLWSCPGQGTQVVARLPVREDM